MTTSTQLSFYIPRLYNDYTVDDVANMFRLMYIGDVRRVDFVQLENSYSHQSAFVHMDCLYQNDFADAIRLIVFSGGGQYKLWIHADVEFWWLMKTTNPVADTHLNIHQVVENARILEAKVVEQESKIQDQSERIERLEMLLSQIEKREKEDEVFNATLDKLYYNMPNHTWFSDTDDKSISSMPSLISATAEDNDRLMDGDSILNQTLRYDDETDDDTDSIDSYSMPSLV
jgi:hypothetical protein